MISVFEAKQRLAEVCRHRPVEWVRLSACEGKILAEDVFSPLDVPSFDNSAMDGYAFGYENAQNLEYLEVLHTIQAGDTQNYFLEKGKTARIFTGAMMPQNSDTVVAQEAVERRENRIFFSLEKIKLGENVRKIASQCRKEQILVKKGTPSNFGIIGLLASVGIEKVAVFSPPRVCLIVTGNELIERGRRLEKGQIYESNGAMLRAYLQKLGITDLTVLRSSDQPEELALGIRLALDRSDMLIVTGGISVGDYDFTQTSLEKAGMQEIFYKIRQKPGKPLWVGKKGDQWAFALPGNPVSALTCFQQYVKPCILAEMGHVSVFEAQKRLPLAHDYSKKMGLAHFLKASTENGEVKILQGQESFNLLAYNETTHIAFFQENWEYVEKGTLIEIFEW